MKLHLYNPAVIENVTLCGRVNSIEVWGGVPAVPLDKISRNPDGKFLGKKLGYCRRCTELAKRRLTG